MAHLFDHRHVARLHDPERLSFQDPSRLLPLIRPYEHGDAAEIGTGSGYFFFPLCEFLSGRGTCLAIELQPEMLEHFEGERKKRDRDLPIRTMVGTADRIGLSDGSMALVWMANVYHELSHPREIFGEIFRILEPVGQLFVIDWKKEETPVGPPFDERASEVSLYDLLIDAGFTRIRSHDLYPYHYVVEALKD
ncbi:MAG: class I SAM-dependent methyltransferase [Nitrospiraceae bacterium]|nr:class I SAM-dependent methyltransferase [Nitrospiraceae bacterium]